MSPISLYRGTTSDNLIQPQPITKKVVSAKASENSLKVVTRLTKVHNNVQTPISSRGTMFSPNFLMDGSNMGNMP